MLLQIKKLLQTEEEMNLWLIIPVISLKKIQPGIRTHDLCDTDAELYQLSYQATVLIHFMTWDALKIQYVGVFEKYHLQLPFFFMIPRRGP